MNLEVAIPVSQGLGLPIIPSYIVCILANMVPVPFIYLFARKVLVWGCDKPVIGKFFTWCLDKGERGGKKLQEKVGRSTFCCFIIICRNSTSGNWSMDRNTGSKFLKDEL